MTLFSRHFETGFHTQNARSNLADFWVYSIADRRWRIISHDTAKDGGPCGRSCHKMVFDPCSGYLYVLGLFEQPSNNDGPAAGVEPDLASDFYRVSTRGLESGNGKWQLLSKNTAVRCSHGSMLLIIEALSNRPMGDLLCCMTIRWHSYPMNGVSMSLEEGSWTRNLMPRGILACIAISWRRASGNFYCKLADHHVGH